MKYTSIILIFIMFIVSCNQKDKNDTIKLMKAEKYEIGDTLILKSLIPYVDSINFKIDEPDLKYSKNHSYRLIVNSSFPNGTFAVIRLTKMDTNCIIKTLNIKDSFYTDYTNNKKIYHRDFTILDSTSNILSIKKWEEFESLIYFTKYWSMNKVYNSKDVLDGITFVLEGSRPDAKKYNKRTYYVYGMLSPNGDEFFNYLCDWMIANSNIDWKH